MNKIVIIKDCISCPFCIFDDGEVYERWGKYWCQRLDREVLSENIPNDCPLENAE